MIDYDYRWGSHLPVLTKVMSQTDGSVLEVGMGLYSTPILHWMCFDKKRELVSYDNEPEFFHLNEQYQNDYHSVSLVKDWDINIFRKWDVVLVDQRPSRSRIDTIRKVANYANYIIVHDTQRNKKFCDFESIYPLFKYRYTYTKTSPNTTVLSNFKDLSFLNEL